jgi:hypothetical protein
MGASSGTGMGSSTTRTPGMRPAQSDRN